MLGCFPQTVSTGRGPRTDTRLNIRCAPLTKSWKERFAIRLGTTLTGILSVIEPGDDIRIVDTRGDHYHRWGTAGQYGIKVSESNFPVLLQKRMDYVEQMNDREHHDRFRLSVYREFVDHGDWDGTDNEFMEFINREGA